MTNPLSTQRQVFRPALLPLFSIIFAVALLAGIGAVLSNAPSTIFGFALGAACVLPLAAALSAAATFFFWSVTAEVLSADGVKVWTPFGRRLLPWQDLEAVRSFPAIRLLCLRFHSQARGTRRVLIFQRHAGEFRCVTANFIPNGSATWGRVSGAEPGAPPNGGPAMRSGNSGVAEGPPSVS